MAANPTTESFGAERADVDTKSSGRSWWPFGKRRELKRQKNYGKSSRGMDENSSVSSSYSEEQMDDERPDLSRIRRDIDILITGAGGNTGMSVITHLRHRIKRLGDHTYRITGLVHDAADRKRVMALGCDKVVVGDAADERSLTKAFRGMDRIYICAPVSEDRVDLTTNYIAAAEKCGAERIVVISTMGAGKTGLFQSEFMTIENSVKEFTGEWTVLRPAFFMENFELYARNIRHGALPLALKNGTIPMVSVWDIGRAASILLLKDDKYYSGKTFTLCAEQIGGVEMARSISTITNHTVAYVPVSNEVARETFTRKGLSPYMQDGLIHMFQTFQANRRWMTGDLKMLTGTYGRTFADYIALNQELYTPGTALAKQDDSMYKKMIGKRNSFAVDTPASLRGEETVTRREVVVEEEEYLEGSSSSYSSSD